MLLFIYLLYGMDKWVFFDINMADNVSVVTSTNFKLDYFQSHTKHILMKPNLIQSVDRLIDCEQQVLKEENKLVKHSELAIHKMN